MTKKRAKTLSKTRSKTRTKTARGAVKRMARAKAKPARRRAAPSRDALDDFIDAAGRTLALPVEPAWKPAIKFNLEVTLRIAAAFAEFPLPDDAEPAPVFVA
jgi:1-carboxybiuret hydrolase subunit AtzG-like